MFSSTLLYPRGQLSVRKWNALCCPDFPHTPKRKRQADQLFFRGKDSANRGENEMIRPFFLRIGVKYAGMPGRTLLLGLPGRLVGRKILSALPAPRNGKAVWGAGGVRAMGSAWTCESNNATITGG